MSGPVSLSQRDILEYAIWGAGCYEDDFLALLAAESSRARPREPKLKEYEAQLEVLRLDIQALTVELARLKKEVV